MLKINHYVDIKTLTMEQKRDYVDRHSAFVHCEKTAKKGQKFAVTVKVGDEYSHPDDFDHYIEQRSQNFEFNFITPSQLSFSELNNYQLIEKIYSIIGGKPKNFNQVLISETMQRDAYSFSPAEGLYQGLEKRIIIKRSVLSNRQRFIAVFLHEIAHAISGATDSSRTFEEELTRLLGIFGEKSLSKGILDIFK